MMASSAAASLLDELMGRHRNANPDDKPKEAHWSDPEVIELGKYGIKQIRVVLNDTDDTNNTDER